MSGILTFCGFNSLQFGDLVINTFAARILKQKYPESKLTFVINKDYKDIAPLFINHPYIDYIKILDKNRDGFNQVDKDWVKNQDFDLVFNPMQDHDHSDPWFLKRHQAAEVCYMHKLATEQECEKFDNKLYLNKWFDTPEFWVYDSVSLKDSGFVVNKKPTVALQAFAGSYNPKNDKMLTIEKAQSIVDYLIKLGFNVLQLGIESEPKLFNTYRFNTDYFNSVKNMLGCKFLITTDSAMSWISSAYEFPTIGLYSNSYYGKEFVKNIQPINPNAEYLDADNVNNIPNQEIFAVIDGMVDKIKS